MKKSLDLIKKTVRILDSVSYENYSDGKTKTYPEYMRGSRADEDKLISPILLPKFLQEILDFKLGKTIATQEYRAVGKPDYIPVDTQTHPFVFDAKGTDTQDLSRHYSQIKKYIVSRNLKHGILTNMRDLDVYTSEEGVEIEEYNFNFVKLYKDYKDNSQKCLKEVNTKRFLKFVENFSYRSLTKEEKIERIARAKPWGGEEELNVKSLIDQLRHIVNILHTDVREKRLELMNMAEVGKVSDESVGYEVEEICAHISGREMGEVNAETFNKIMNSEEATLYGKARDAFFRRVAYFAMTRLLLARVWEDIRFIEQSLYNGGFAKWYENFNREIRRVLHYAFDLSAERYPWLFNVDNNYSWYEPSDTALIDSLYSLSNFYLGKLDQDILGTIYEDYIEKVDKKNKGQYYTPREIVSFIWDRVGYTNPKAFFWHINGKRKPKFIFDPATGSGGFLVEAARRIREESNLNFNDFNDLLDARTAILAYLFGSEISLFPYYLTEVNLLIQLTPIIRRMRELKKRFKAQPYSLSVICVDSLSLYNLQPSLLPDETREYKVENTHKILSLDPQKKIIYQKLKDKFAGNFAYCCANPPYVGEAGHKELFRRTLSQFPYWKKYHQGKMDYLYWFIILGLSKLRDWGKLGFITSAYWPTADGASKLRKHILQNAIIKEMIFFESVKIFEHAKGQHNMVFILQKITDSAKATKGKSPQDIRNNNRIKIVKVKCEGKDLPYKTIRENLAFLTQHISKHINKPKYEDEYIKSFWSGIRQGELNENSWNLICSRETDAILRNIENKATLLGKLCNLNTGVSTGADKVTKTNIGLLHPDIIAKYDIKIGAGIFVLSEEELKSLNPNKEEAKLIKLYFRDADIDQYIINKLGKSQKYLIYLSKKLKIEKYPHIKQHLEKFNAILSNRTECRDGSIPWYGLYRPRSQKIFEREKIVTPYRAEQNTFTIDQKNNYYLKSITLLSKKKNIKESLYYFLGLLNSSLLDYWFKYRGKSKGKIREYFTTPLYNIPIRCINFDNTGEVKLHDKIVEKVKEIREEVSGLVKYSDYFFGMRLTKLEFDAPLPEVNTEAIIKSIASENLYNLRTHPQIKTEKPKGFEEDKFYLSKVDKPELILTGNAQLKLAGKDRTWLFIAGPYDNLKLLADILNNWKGKPWSEIKEKLLLPDNVVSFNAQKNKVLNDVRDVRTKILLLQKEIDQIVYKIYGLTKEEIWPNTTTKSQIRQDDFGCD